MMGLDIEGLRAPENLRLYAAIYSMPKRAYARGPMIPPSKESKMTAARLLEIAFELEQNDSGCAP